MAQQILHRGRNVVVRYDVDYSRFVIEPHGVGSRGVPVRFADTQADAIKKAKAMAERMESRSNPVSHARVTKVPQAEIRWLVGRYHVGTSDADIEWDIRRRAKGPRWTPAMVKKTVAYALKVHHENQKMYNDVMSGRIGRNNPKRKSARGVTKPGWGKLTSAYTDKPHWGVLATVFTAGGKRKNLGVFETEAKATQAVKWHHTDHPEFMKYELKWI